MTVILNNKVRTWVTKLVIGFSMGHRHRSISPKRDRLFRTTILPTLTLARRLALGPFRLLLDVEPVPSCTRQ